MRKDGRSTDRSATSGPARPLRKRLERILEVVREAPRVVVVTHDNPDPDAVASGWGIVQLIASCLEMPVDFVAGGVISRAENHLLVELLSPPLRLVDDWSPPGDAAVVAVDTTRPARLAKLKKGTTLAAAIDHHGASNRGRPPFRFRFRDVRPRVAASSSMVTAYLREAGLVPDRFLATALLYGIHTDAKGGEGRFSWVDRRALAWLPQHSDPDLYQRIEHAPVSKEYFEDLLLALQSSFTYEDAALCFLPSASGTETVGEVADLLIRCRGIERVLCGTALGDRMVFSARTTHAGGDATALLVKTLSGEAASCGGHGHRAGGFVSLEDTSSREVHELESRIRGAWLDACGIERQRGTRLVPRKEILRAME